MTLAHLFQLTLARNRTDLAIRQAELKQGYAIEKELAERDLRGESIDGLRPENGPKPERVGDVRPCVKSGCLRPFNPNADVRQPFPNGRWTV